MTVIAKLAEAFDWAGMEGRMVLMNRLCPDLCDYNSTTTLEKIIFFFILSSQNKVDVLFCEKIWYINYAFYNNGKKLS